jgi:hypothetical protein
MLIKDEYNVAKYLDAFNKKVKPLLVCFDIDIRKKILLNIKKDKVTKLEKLDARPVFTEAQCVLVSGMPNKPEDQDSYEDLMTMEDKEIKFWVKVNKIPINMTEDEFALIKEDYLERKRIEKEEGLANERLRLQDIFKQIEYDELLRIREGLDLPLNMFNFSDLDMESGDIISLKWGEIIGNFVDILKYENEIKERYDWYQLTNNNSSDRYQQWIEYRNELEDTYTDEGNTSVNINETIKKVAEKIKNNEIKIPKLVESKVSQTEDDNDDEDEEDENEEPIDDFSPEFQKFEFNVEVQPEVNIVESSIEKIDEDDEWNMF